MLALRVGYRIGLGYDSNWILFYSFSFIHVPVSSIRVAVIVVVVATVVPIVIVLTDGLLTILGGGCDGLNRLDRLNRIELGVEASNQASRKGQIISYLDFV